MNKGVKAAIAGLALAGVTAGAVAPAEAHGAGLAIGAGLLGVGIGAAIASDHPHYVGYAPPPPPVYYAPPPPPPGYYAAPRCRVGWHWSRYWGQYVQDRRCY